MQTTAPVARVRIGDSPLQGSWATLDQAYAAIGAWVEQNGYQTAGPCREVYLEEDGDPETHVTEIQFPVTHS